MIRIAISLAEEILRPAEEPAIFSKGIQQDQVSIRHCRALLGGNHFQAAATAREAVRLASESTWWFQVGLEEEALHHPRAAAEAYSRFPKWVTSMEMGWASWPLSRWARVQHELDEYEKQLELAQRGYRESPEHGFFYGWEASALIALDRLGDVEEVISRCGKATLQSGSIGMVLNTAARELAAHGHRDAATAMAGRAAAWYKERLGVVKKPSAALQSSYVTTLIRAGDCAQGLPIRRELMQTYPDNLDYQGAYAVALIMCDGSRTEARQIAESLSKVDRPYLFGTHLYQRARILAALGDREAAMLALQAVFAQGLRWDGVEMHLDNCWDLLRDYPPFIELIRPSQVHLKSPKQAAFSGQLSAISNCCTYLLKHFESKNLKVDATITTEDTKSAKSSW